MKAIFQHAAPYADDKMNLPVEDIDRALPFYETVMGFRVISRPQAPHRRVVLSRDAVRIGLAENGGDSSQEGCFFEVNDVEAAFAELRNNGLDRDDPQYSIETYASGATYKVFFFIAPDGLCYCIGEHQTK